MHSFENRRVSIVRDIGDRAVPHLQNDSYGDFQHSKQCKYKEKYLSECSQEKTNLSSGKSERQLFFPISGRHVGAHVHGHQHGVPY